MKIGQKKLLVLVIVLVVGLSLGYFFGFDHGFEKAVVQRQEATEVCRKEAEVRAREDLKPKYGDPVSMELLLSSPHYQKHYSQCLEKI